MATFDNVLDRITAKPFRPFRLKVAGGHDVEITKSEMICVGITAVSIWMSTTDDDHERWHHIPLAKIETLELIETTASGAG